MAEVAGEASDRVPVRASEFESAKGNLFALALTPTGSSFLQSCLRAFPEEARAAARNELLPHTLQLAADDHGAYCLRLVFEFDREALHAFIADSRATDIFWASLCRTSLHTRRFVQFVIENVGHTAHVRLYRALQAHFMEVVGSKEGCIAAQRILDGMPLSTMHQVADVIRQNLVELSANTHAHFVICYTCRRLRQEDAVARPVASLAEAATLLQVGCARYGSTCLETLLKMFPVEIGSLVRQAFDAFSDAELVRFANDAFGNYVVQRFVAAADTEVTNATLDRLNRHASELTFGPKILRKGNAVPMPTSAAAASAMATHHRARTENAGVPSGTVVATPDTDSMVTSPPRLAVTAAASFDALPTPDVMQMPAYYYSSHQPTAYVAAPALPAVPTQFHLFHHNASPALYSPRPSYQLHHGNPHQHYLPPTPHHHHHQPHQPHHPHQHHPQPHPQQPLQQQMVTIQPHPHMIPYHPHLYPQLLSPQLHPHQHLLFSHAGLVAFVPPPPSGGQLHPSTAPGGGNDAHLQDRQR